jgi:hypothetical protein
MCCWVKGRGAVQTGVRRRGAHAVVAGRGVCGGKAGVSCEEEETEDGKIRRDERHCRKKNHELSDPNKPDTCAALVKLACPFFQFSWLAW